MDRVIPKEDNFSIQVEDVFEKNKRRAGIPVRRPRRNPDE